VQLCVGGRLVPKCLYGNLNHPNYSNQALVDPTVASINRRSFNRSYDFFFNTNPPVSLAPCPRYTQTSHVHWSATRGSTVTYARPIRRLCNSRHTHRHHQCHSSRRKHPSCSFKGTSYKATLMTPTASRRARRPPSFTLQTLTNVHGMVSPYLTRLAGHGLSGMGKTSFIFTLFACCCDPQAMPTFFCTYSTYQRIHLDTSMRDRE